MKPAIESGSAPGKLVVMVTTPFSVFGYARTCRELNERSPTTKIIRLTTEASTGRRMKRSVNFMRRAPYSFGGVGFGSFVGSILLLMITAVPLRSFIWPAETTTSPCVDAAQHGHLIAARRAQLDEALQNGIAVAVVGLLDHINRVAVGVVGDGGLRQRYLAGRLAGLDRRSLANMPGTSRRSALWNEARTWTLRLAVSTLELIDSIDTGEVDARIRVDRRRRGLARS